MRLTKKAMVAAACIAAVVCLGPGAGRADAAERQDRSFLLALQPTEGVLLALSGSKDRKTDRGWQLDRERTSGLDHVDVVDVGVRPGRVAPGGTDAVERLKGLFETPKLWGWGIRARSAGHAEIVLRHEPSAAGGAAGSIVIQVEVVDEGQNALFRLPFRPGERATLEIWTNPSTGAQWRVDPDASTGLGSVAIEPGRTYDPSDPTDWRLRDRVGAPMLQEWRIEAAEAGTASITLDYGPPWEKQTLYRQLRIDVTLEAVD